MTITTEERDENMSETELLTTLVMCIATNKQPCEITKNSIITTMKDNTLTPLTVISLRKIGGVLQTIATELERKQLYAV